MRIFGTFRMAPWWRGPLLLPRRPGVVVALVAAALVATLPAAAAGPFLSSSRDATLHHQIAASCPAALGLQIIGGLSFDPGNPAVAPDGTTLTGAAVAGTRDNATRTAAAGAGLGTPVSTLLASVTVPGEQPTDLSLVSRAGADQHVHVLDGPSGTGVWIPDQYAAFAHLGVGDTVRLVSGDPPTSVHGTLAAPPSRGVRVAAIYRDLRSSADDPWWCGLREVYRGPAGAEFSNRTVPPVVLADRDTFLMVATGTQLTGAQEIELPVTDPDLDQDRARALVAGIAAARTRLAAISTGVFGAGENNHTRMTSTLSGYVAHADLARSGMLPAVLPITAAGVLVGLLVVAAATIFWVQRRRRELTVLSAHGVGAPSLGLKAVTETLPALLIGAVAGWITAWLLVHALGPDPVLSGEAAPLALGGALVTLAAAVLVAGLVAMLASRGLTDQTRSRHHRLVRALPWELALLAAAPLAWAALGDGRQTTAEDPTAGSVAHVPGRLLIVPIMVVAGLVVLAGRLGVAWVGRRGRRYRPGRPAPFLAWRRISREAVMSAVLAGATAVPVGLAAYGATVTGSVRATIAAEATLHLGSDVVVTLRQRVPVPAGLAGSATEVLRLNGAQIAGVHTDVLAIDPDGFARDAFWVDSLAGRPLSDLLAPLRAAGAGGAVPAVASDQVATGDQAATWSGGPLAGGTLRVTGTTTLPAEQGGYPVALVTTRALGDDAQYAVPQLWIRGDPDRIRRAVEAANLPVAQISVAADSYANTLFEPLTYTFAYLTALSLLTGLVTLVGLLLYLESRAPVHRRAYVLLRRMGLRARSHRRALLGELAVPLSFGLLAGLAVTAGLTVLLSPYFEMNPTIPPGTVVVVPYPSLLVLAGAVLLIMLGATGYAHRRVSRAAPSEVLRDTI